VSAPVARRIEFSTAEVAALCGVSAITVRVWITRGHLRRNGRGRIDGTALVAFMDWRDERGRRLEADTPPTPD
jgi:hypothetical protein